MSTNTNGRYCNFGRTNRHRTSGTVMSSIEIVPVNIGVSMHAEYRGSAIALGNADKGSICLVRQKQSRR